MHALRLTPPRGLYQGPRPSHGSLTVRYTKRLHLQLQTPMGYIRRADRGFANPANPHVHANPPLLTHTTKPPMDTSGVHRQHTPSGPLRSHSRYGLATSAA